MSIIDKITQMFSVRGKTRTMKCENCGLRFEFTPQKNRVRRYCSFSCRIQGEVGEKHSHWKGDEVGLRGLHYWMRTQIPKPALCPICGLREPYDITNKGIYDRNPENWQWMCRRCHLESDGRLYNNFMKFVYSPTNRPPNTVLDEYKVNSIRKWYSDCKVSYAEIGRHYKVGRGCIRDIILGKTWKWLLA